MSNEQEKILARVETLFKQAKNELTKEDFDSAFKQVVELILKREKMMMEHVDVMEKLYAEITRKQSDIHFKTFEDFRKKMTEMVDAKLATLKDGEDGVDGKDADEEMMMQKMMAQMKPMHEAMMKEIAGLLPVSIEDVKNLRKELDELRRLRATGGRMFGGGTSTIGVQAALGRILISGEEVSFSGTSGTLANIPASGTEKLFRGGVRMQRGTGKDYTISGATVTLATAAVVGEIFLADYEKA